MVALVSCGREDDHEPHMIRVMPNGAYGGTMCPGIGVPYVEGPMEKAVREFMKGDAMKGTTFKSDIVLGEEYEETHTGIKGTATGCFFYLHGCERVNLEVLGLDGELHEYTFDAPRLKNVKTEKVATATRTGGHQKKPPARGLK